MAVNTKFENLKKVSGGIRSDAAPVTADGEPVALRLNSASELVVSVGTSGGVTEVQGPDADGAPSTGNPVLIAGEDGAGNVETILTDTDGRIQTDLVRVGGTAIITGGVAGTQGVGGIDADGAAATGRPVQIAGVDGAANVQALLMDTAGRPQNDIDRWGGTDVLSAGVAGVVAVGGTSADNAVADATNPVKLGGVADDVLSAVSDGDTAHLITDIYRRLQVRTAGFDETTDVVRTASTNQEADRKAYNALASVTNSADGTFDYYIDLEGCNSFSLYYNLNGGGAGATAGVTMTLWGTIQDDGTADASCLYVDITNRLLGAASIVAAPTVTVADIVTDTNGHCRNMKYVRVRIVAASTGSTADWILQSRHKVRF